MLNILLTALYVVVCLLLVIVVLMQQGKGGDIAAAFGGSGSQTAFGARGRQRLDPRYYGTGRPVHDRIHDAGHHGSARYRVGPQRR